MYPVDGMLSSVLAALEKEIAQLRESMVELKQEQESVRQHMASMQSVKRDEWDQNEVEDTLLGDLIDPSLFPETKPMKGLASTNSFASSPRRSAAISISLEHLRLSRSAFLPFVLEDATKVKLLLMLSPPCTFLSH